MVISPESEELQEPAATAGKPSAPDLQSAQVNNAEPARDRGGGGGAPGHRPSGRSLPKPRITHPKLLPRAPRLCHSVRP